MKSLAHFLISLELLWKNPAEWWPKQHWLFKLVAIVLVIPAISVASITLNQHFSQNSSQEVMKLQRETIQELIALKTRVKELEQQNRDLTEQMSALDTPLSAAILGTEDASTTQENQLLVELEAQQQETDKLIQAIERGDDITQLDLSTETTQEITEVDETSTKNQPADTSDMVYLPKTSGQTVKIYQNASSASPVVTKIATGTWYTVLQKQPEWYLLQTEEAHLSGWIPADLVQEP